MWLGVRVQCSLKPGHGCLLCLGYYCVCNSTTPRGLGFLFFFIAQGVQQSARGLA
jgi:hypothetical protein